MKTKVPLAVIKLDNKKITPGSVPIFTKVHRRRLCRKRRRIVKIR